MEILKAMERVRHSKNTKRWWPKNDSNNYYSKQCLHVSRMKNSALSFHGHINLGFLLLLRKSRSCREIKRHLLTKEQRVKDMMAINVMSLFAPDPGFSSSSLLLFSTYPCRAFSVFTPPHGLPRGWLAENTSDSTAQTGPEANSTHINKHTRAACRGWTELSCGRWRRAVDLGMDSKKYLHRQPLLGDFCQQNSIFIIISLRNPKVTLKS